MSRVSVIIPTYNRAGMLLQTIESVLRQTYIDFELIVVDDGSTDQTEDVVRSFGERVCYHRLTHTGFGSEARNFGLDVACGEFVAFLDSDDLWYPDKLKRQCAAFGKEPDAVIVYCDCDIVDADGRVKLGRVCDRPGCIAEGRIAQSEPWDDAYKQLMLGNFIATPTPLLRTSVVRAVGGFDVALRYCEDHDLWLRVAHEGTVVYVPEVLASYREYDSSYSKSRRDLQVENHKIVYDKIARQIEGDPGRQAFYRKALGVTRRAWCLIYLQILYENPELNWHRRLTLLSRATREYYPWIWEESHAWKYCLRTSLRRVCGIRRISNTREPK